MTTTYGTSSHVSLSSAISGTGTSVAPATIITYLKAKEVEFDISFDSKISNQAFGKSRLTPDVKYKQGFSVSDAVLVGASDTNGTKEWIMDAYIAKTPIYAIVEMPPATGSTYAKHLWYNSDQSKVYYLKGEIGKLKFKLESGRLIKVSLDFKECWSP